ncbi:energy transducer TonB [uncultured Mucilaginibacter sp.]|uniref:energy transducer TonB n=1 Tax=uncultured Mucilaginibacter sp. TaxID=797541 RepID=UPI0025E859B1|nr:energy transducer TonB [uncultured Mucilaginibacter sp.]
MKLFFLTILIFTASVASAQQKVLNVTFLKNNGKQVDNRDSADYIRQVSAPDSGTVLFNVDDFYKDGKRKLVGKTSKADHVYLEGVCTTYFNSGVKKSTCTYVKGVKKGSDYNFFPNGKPYLQLLYPENGGLNNDVTGNYLIAMNYDSLGNKLVENGNGYLKVFDDSFKTVIEEGGIKNGKRDGVCKGLFDKNKARFTETYTNGSLVEGTAVYEDGSTSVYKAAREVNPQFKGGLDAFYKYLSRHIKYPDDAKENAIQGTVVLSFIVERDGKTSNVKITKGVYPSIDNEALRVMKDSHVWLPGTQFGRPVRVQYGLPINFFLGS